MAEPPRYERRDFPPQPILLVLAGLFGLVLLSLGAVALLLWLEGGTADGQSACLAVPEQVPGPPLSVSPRTELARYRAEQATRQPAVDAAMRRLAASGWPSVDRTEGRR